MARLQVVKNNDGEHWHLAAEAGRGSLHEYIDATNTMVRSSAALQAAC